MLNSRLRVGKIELFERVKCHDSSSHQEQRKHQNILELILLVEPSAKEHIDILLDRSVAGLWGGVVFAFKIVVEFTTVHSYNCALVGMILRQHETFVHVVSWSYPVCEFKETRHELRPNNEAREEIIEPNEDAGQNLGRRHARYQAHESLPKVRIDCQVESKYTL